MTKKQYHKEVLLALIFTALIMWFGVEYNIKKMIGLVDMQKSAIDNFENCSNYHNIYPDFNISVCIQEARAALRKMDLVG